jgi:hypothetical protein
MQAKSRAELLVLTSLLSLLAEKGLLTRQEINGAIEDAAAALRAEEAMGDGDAGGGDGSPILATRDLT